MSHPQKEAIMLNAARSMTGWRMAIGVKDVQPKPIVDVGQSTGPSNSKVAPSLDRWLLTLFRSQ